jgi:hypothetical protein
MNSALLLQDAAVRALPRWFAVAAGVAVTTLGLLLNIATFMRAKHGAELSVLVTVASFSLVMWLSAGTFLLTAAFRKRCGDFAATLPLTVQHLWLTHCAAVALVGVSVTIAVTAIGIGVLSLVARITGHPLLLDAAGMVHLGASVLVTFALATAVLQARFLNVIDLPWNRRFVRLAPAALAVGWGLTMVLALLPHALLLVPAVATALLVARTLRALPPAFVTLPLPGDAASAGRLEADGADADAASKRAAESSAAAWTANDARRYSVAQMAGLFLFTIHRTAPKALSTAIFAVPGMMFFGVLLAGTIDAFDDDGSAAFRWISIPLTVYMLLAIFAKPLKGLQLVDPLPVSRRSLFALLILPSLLFLGMGYGAGRWIVWAYAPHQDVDLRVVTSNCSGVTVPRSLLRIAWAGEPAAIDTPWGESYEAWRVPMYRGSRAVVYSPYCSSDSSATDAFVALLASRAAAALYGESVPESEIQDRYLGPNATQAELSLRQDYAHLRVQARHASSPLLAVFVCCGWFAVVALYLRMYRSGIGDRMRTWTLVSLLVFIMLIHIAQFLPFVMQYTEPWIVEAFWEIHMRALAQAIPGGTPTLWLLGAAMVVIFYRIAERQFVRAEFLAQDVMACYL